MLQNSSVVPEGPNIIYHIISMSWLKQWEAYVDSETDTNETMQPINTISDLKQIVITKDLLDLGGVEFFQH